MEHVQFSSFSLFNKPMYVLMNLKREIMIKSEDNYADKLRKL